MAPILVNGFNLGVELVAVSFNWNGNTMNAEQLGHLKSIAPKSEIDKVISTPCIYGGLRLHRNIYHDFSGTIEFDRFNNNLTNLFLGIMNNAQTTGAETYFNIYGVVNNTDAGNTTEYLYYRTVLDEHDPGKFAGSGEVGMSIGFRCQQLIEVGAAANIWLKPPAPGNVQ